MPYKNRQKQLDYMKKYQQNIREQQKQMQRELQKLRRFVEQIQKKGRK